MPVRTILVLAANPVIPASPGHPSPPPLRLEEEAKKIRAAIRSSDRRDEFGIDHIGELVAYGASPRGPIALVQSARALALVHGRDYVIPADIRALAKDAFRHRLVLTYQALAEERSADDVLDAVLAAVPQPRLELGRPAAA